MGPPAIDPEDIVRRLIAPRNTLEWTPLEPDRKRVAPGSQEFDRGPIDFLHANWAPADTFDPASAGTGIVGRIIAVFGRITYRVLRPYFLHEREVMASLVQANVALEQRCDELVRRQHELEEAAVARQIAEARNLTDLAVVLDDGGRTLGRTGPGSPDSGSVADGSR